MKSITGELHRDRQKENTDKKQEVVNVALILEDIFVYFVDVFRQGWKRIRAQHERPFVSVNPKHTQTHTHTDTHYSDLH